MRQFKLGIFVCILLTLSSCVSSDRPYTPAVPSAYIQRIEVPPTGTEKVVEGVLREGYKQYVINASKGDRLGIILRAETQNAWLSVIYLSTGEALTAHTLGMSQEVPVTGDYLVSVYGEPQRYTLAVTLR